jgi:HipA-like protein
MGRKFTERLRDILDSWGIQLRPARSRGGRSLRVSVVLSNQDRVSVGSLRMADSEFVFQYTESFKKRKDLPAISAFPNKDEVYRSSVLWPFFEVRLPPMDRPDVARVIEEKHLDTEDTLGLLGELGRRVVATPYELDLVAGEA